jgi:hypothetical protein
VQSAPLMRSSQEGVMAFPPCDCESACCALLEKMLHIGQDIDSVLTQPFLFNSRQRQLRDPCALAIAILLTLESALDHLIPAGAE